MKSGERDLKRVLLFNWSNVEPRITLSIHCVIVMTGYHFQITAQDIITNKSSIFLHTYTPTKKGPSTSKTRILLVYLSLPADTESKNTL